MIKIPSVRKKSRLIYWGIGLIVVLGLGYLLIFKKSPAPETVVVHPGEFVQQVSVSGKVTPVESLDLAFEQSGIVRRVLVKTGDQVKAGQVLVSQDIDQLSAQLAEMQAGIELQKAKLAQSNADPYPADLKIKQDAVATAELDLKNAYDNETTTLQQAYDTLYGSEKLAKSIQYTYFNSGAAEDGKVQVAYKGIQDNLADAQKYINNLGSRDLVDTATLKIITDLNGVYAYLRTIREQTDQDVYYWTIPAADKTSIDDQRSAVGAVLTELLSAKQAVTSAKSALTQANNEVDSLLSLLRPEDIAVYEAQIKQAQASAQSVVAQIRKRQIIAPIDGVITQVNAKVGSTLTASAGSQAGQVAVSMISSGKFQIESYVPEIYIALVKVGNDADVTLDSYGSDTIFKAKVISIDPSETIKDGVSTYKITLELDDNGQVVRDGMTANVVITTAKKDNVISILQGTVSTKNGKKIVKVLDGKDIIEREVVLGDVSSSGQVEILAGLSDGDVVVVK